MVDLIGKEIGSYHIRRRIGTGGMAEVYLGEHTLLGRSVAIKVLHGYLTEYGDFMARFQREAMAVANLRHPNIVHLYDFNVQDDLIFMVMEYIEGTNLQEELAGLGQRGERTLIMKIGTVIRDIANALDYAHSQAMLHRDVKPSNILINKQGKAYLADFGIARIVSDHKLTVTGTLIGTPAYMSPEQCRGEDLSVESDIYSLGIIAFEILAGRVPYDAQTPIGIIHKQVSEPVPELSQFAQDTPPRMQAVIERVLAKSPADRYPTASAFAEDLMSVLNAFRSLDSRGTEGERLNIERDIHESVEGDLEMEADIPGSDRPTEAMVTAEVPGLERESGMADLEQPTVWMDGEETSDLDLVEEPSETLEHTVVMDDPMVPGRGEGGADSIFDQPTVKLREDDIHPQQDQEGQAEIHSPPGIEFLNSTQGTPREKLTPEVEHGRNSFPSNESGSTDSLIRKIPVWGWISVGVLLVGLVVIGITQLNIPSRSSDSTGSINTQISASPIPSESPLERGEVEEMVPEDLVLVLDQTHAEGGLSLLSGANMDTEVVMEGDQQAWRSGNGQALPSGDGNTQEDNSLAFDVDDSQINGLTPGGIARVEITFLDEGNDSFSVEYDAHAGEGASEELTKITETFSKPGKGEEKLIVIHLIDPYFGNTLDGADFTINDQGDGAETFTKVKVHLFRIMDGVEYFTKGQSLYKSERYAEALDYLDVALLKGFSTNTLYETLIDTFVQLGQIEQALTTSQRALEIYPEDVALRLLRGEIYWQQLGDEERALQEFNLAHEMDSSDTDFYYTRAQFYRETGRYDSAIQDYTILLSLEPQDPLIPLWRGDCYNDQGHLDLASQDYDTFLAMSVGNPAWDYDRERVQSWLDSQTFKPLVLVLDGDHTEHGLLLPPSFNSFTEVVPAGDTAEKAWRTGSEGDSSAAAEDSRSSDPYINLDVDDHILDRVLPGALVLIQIEYLDEGYDTFSLQYDAYSGGPYNNGAFKPVESTQKTNSGNFLTVEYLLEDAEFANQLHDQYDFRIDDHGDGAETIHRVEVFVFPLLSAERYYLEGEKLVNTGDYNLAARYFDLAVDQGYDEPIVFERQVFAYLQSSQPEQALAALDKALALHPQDAYYHTLKGGIYWWDYGDAESAREEFDQAIEISSDDLRVYRERGLFFLDQMAYDLCVDDLTRYISQNSWDEFAIVRRGDCYSSMADIDHARQDYKLFLSMTDNNLLFPDERERVQGWLDTH